MRCSCGAVLPEDARFCHKCGKPQYEEDIARLNAPVETPIPPPAPAAKPLASIGFRNGRAIRITLLVAGVSLIAFDICGAIFLPLAFVVIVASGYASARIYQNRTSENLTATGAAALGAMSALWLFLALASLTLVSLLSEEGQKAMKIAISSHPEYAPVLQDPHRYAPLLIASFIFALLIGAVSSAFGGIMAVRTQPRSGASR